MTRRRGFVGLVAAATIVWIALGMSRGLLLSEDIKSRVWPWAPFLPQQDIAAPALSDPVWQFVPWLQFARVELAAGRLPLWNPHQSGGVPLLANAQSALGSPLVWPVLVAGVGAGWNLSLLARILLAFAAAFLWLRDLGRSPLAAAMGGAAFALSGPFIAWLEHPQTLTAAAAPLVLLFVRRLARAAAREDFVGLALSVYVVASGGHPETLLMTALLSAAVLAVEGIRSPRAALAPLAAAILGAGLAAPVLFPFVEYFGHSSARFGFGRRPYVLPLQDLTRFVIPHRAGSNVIEAASTFSITLLVLAAAGVAWRRREKGTLLWTLTAGVILLVAYDNPVARALAERTPVHWSRALLLLPLAAAFLGSGVLDALRRRLDQAGRGLLSRAIGAAAVALVAAELLRAAQGVHGHSPASDLALTTPLLERLSADREPFRVLGLHTFFPADSATAAGLDDVRGFDAMSPRGWSRQLAAMGTVERLPTQDEAIEPWGLARGGAALDFWNVKYLLLHPQFAFGAAELNSRAALDLEEVYSGPDGRILLNRRAQPRARLSGPGTVTVETRFPGRWTLSVDSAVPGRLTVADPMFPGWRARVDGQTAPLDVPEGEAMSVAVDAGSHRVELRYRPVAFRWGVAAAAAAAALLAAASARLPRRSALKPS